jgi:hypothetical protein
MLQRRPAAREDAHQAMNETEVTAKEVRLVGSDASWRDFVAEAFFSQHNLFIMVTQKKAARFDRRARAAAS